MNLTHALSLSVPAYVALLVFVGWRADRLRTLALSRRWRSIQYALSLATLCSAWTYFGAVGDASGGSWLFLANALGPILAITLGYPVWRRIAVLAKQENVGSLADFLAARYGKSRTLGILATLVSTLGALPYIALQITILTQVWMLATGHDVTGPIEAMILILMLAGIAIVFGARRPSLTQHNRGFVAMIGIESLVKLTGLLGVAGLCLYLMGSPGGQWSAALRAVPPLSGAVDSKFLTLTLLCTVTAFTLPRQFHLGFVTLEDPGDIRTAVWLVPLYFLAWSAATLVIAVGIRMGQGMPGVAPHLQVLALPLRHGQSWLSLLALLGGLSAGAAMVIVETTAISAMVSNEIILPLIAGAMQRPVPGRAVATPILLVRRATILGIGLAAWLYYLGIRSVEGPTQLGQTALTAFAQLLPALLGGVFWRGGHARGAIAGICAGMLVWAVAIAAPAFLATPQGVGLDSLTLWSFMPSESSELPILVSLALNTGLYVAVSLISRARLIDTIQANSFVRYTQAVPRNSQQAITATFGDLQRVLAQFLGEDEAKRALLDFQVSARTGILAENAEVTPVVARAAERLLAGAIGAPSARNVIAIALAAKSQDAREISRILDEAGHAIHFSRELLQTTLEALAHGVSVVDADQRLVAWNANFLELVGLPVGQVHIGKPLDQLFEMEAGDDAQVMLRGLIAAKREIASSRRPYREEIALADGRWLLIAGEPLGADEYLETFADITELKEAERVLTRSNEELEQLVRERTRALLAANEELALAKQMAEQAMGAQRRFVAAASHDLVQPLHAARLFIGNALVGEDEASGTHSLLRRADQAVEGAHRLLRALLNLSQLESGALKVKPEPVDAGELLDSLAVEFAEQAEARGIVLIVMPTNRWVLSDRDLLRSMLQNLLVNALRYTPEGRVLVALRYAKNGLRFEVRDSGIGIASGQLPEAFGEYSRLPEGRSLSEGAGLGLSIVSRIGRVLEHPLAVRSRIGRGSVFSITVPETQPRPAPRWQPVAGGDLGGLRVLCIDDEADVLAGGTALIERWGGLVTAAASAGEVDVANGDWDVAIADYYLGGDNGLDLLRSLAGRVAVRLLLTATPDGIDTAQLSREGIALMLKPIAPLALQAILSAAAGSLHTAEGRSRASASN